MPDLSVAILSYNTRDCLKQCLDTLHTAAGAATTGVSSAIGGDTVATA